MDDLRVVHGISGGRYGCDKAVQIVRAADLVEVAIRNSWLATSTTSTG